MLVHGEDFDLSKQMQLALSKYAFLKALFKSQENELAVVASSERATLQAMAILNQLKELRDTGEIFNRAERGPLLKALDKLKGQIMSKPLLKLTDAEHLSAEQGPGAQPRPEEFDQLFAYRSAGHHRSQYERSLLSG